MGGKSLDRMKTEWYWKAKNEELGKLQAQRETKARVERPKKVGLSDLQNYFIDKIKEMDPIDLLAIGGIAVVIQPALLTEARVLDYAAKNKLSGLQTFAESIVAPFNAFIGFPPEELKGPAPVGLVLLSWVLALIIAAITVKYLPRMMGGAQKIGDFINTSGILTGLLL